MIDNGYSYSLAKTFVRYQSSASKMGRSNRWEFYGIRTGGML